MSQQKVVKRPFPEIIEELFNINLNPFQCPSKVSLEG